MSSYTIFYSVNINAHYTELSNGALKLYYGRKRKKRKTKIPRRQYHIHEYLVIWPFNFLQLLSKTSQSVKYLLKYLL